jgi:predicted MFS family arabinose efflux permease
MAGAAAEQRAAAGEALSHPPPVSTRMLLAILGAAGFASTASMRMVEPLVPLLSSEFGVPVATIATLSTAFGLSYALGQPVVGALGDGFGKARTIAFAAFTLTAILVASSFATSFSGLFWLRCLAGVAAGGLIPVAMAAIADRVPLAERQVTVARFIIFVTLGQMAGSLLSGVVADLFGWPMSFRLASIIALGAALAVFLGIKPRPGAARPSPSVSAAVAGYRSVFDNPMTLPLVALVCVEGMVSFGMLPYLAALLKERSGVGASEAGLVIAGGGFGAILFGMLASFFVARLGPRRMPILGGWLVASNLCLFALPLPWWTGVPFNVLGGLGFMLMHSPLQLLATELSPQNRGSAIAVFAMSLFFGQAIGPVILGVLPHSSANPSGLLVFAAAAAGLGFAIARLKR